MTQGELVEILTPLIDFQSQTDFDAVTETSGYDVAVAYAIGKNCVEALASAGEDDWLEEIIRTAYSQLSADRQAKFAETGL